jgi:uncharacterized membrane protein
VARVYCQRSVQKILGQLYERTGQLGVFIFVILPAVQKNSLASAILLGALFGFFTYATYDLTNLATLKNWPLNIVFIDILWGTVLTSIVGTAGFYIVKFVQ